MITHVGFIGKNRNSFDKILVDPCRSFIMAKPSLFDKEILPDADEVRGFITGNRGTVEDVSKISAAIREVLSEKAQA